MISTFTAIFDSCVLFGIRLTSLLMELAMSGLFRARWSDDIHREWMQAVSQERGIPIEQLQHRREAMDGAVLDCCVSGYENLIEALTLPDPKDRHVLAAAIKCDADVIVTFNAKHFPMEVLNQYGIHTKHPDEFILDVEGIYQGALIEAAKNDFKHYQDPPLSVDDYIEGLRKANIPKTADYLDKLRVLITT